VYALKREEKEFDKQWGVFYEELKDYDNFGMQYYTAYVLRRMLFVMIVYYLGDFVSF